MTEPLASVRHETRTLPAAVPDGLAIVLLPEAVEVSRVLTEARMIVGGFVTVMVWLVGEDGPPALDAVRVAVNVPADVNV